MANGILKKILSIQSTLEVEKTGYDERNEYFYFRGEDVARSVRKAMSEAGVIHRTVVTEWREDNFYDKTGRNRPRVTFSADVIFIDAEDGSEFKTSVVATGSDQGGDKGPRKAHVQAFKIAAVDTFLITEETGKFDSDDAPEASPVNMSDDRASEPEAVTIASIVDEIGAIVRDEGNPIEAKNVDAVGVRIAESKGISTTRRVWSKDLGVMSEVVKALKNGEVE